MNRFLVLPLLLALAACARTSDPQRTDVPAEGRAAQRTDAPRGLPSVPLVPPAPKKPARGAEERVNGVRVLHLSGTPEEMGAQMGQFCAADLRHLVEANLKKIPWLAKDLDGALAKAKRHGASIPGDQMRELRATAKAADVGEDWLVLAATVVEVVEETRACAAAAAWGDATTGKETLVGRNLDWHNMGKLNEHGLIVVRHPENARPTLSCGFPGLPGVLTGMNGSGLFVANLVQFSWSAPAGRDGAMPIMSLQRVLLEQCTTAEEAVRRIESEGRTVPQNYIVADAQVAVFVETDSGRVVRREPQNQTLAGTNWAGEERGTLKGDARFGMLCASLDPKVGTIGVPEIEAALGAANAGPLSVMSVIAMPSRRALRVSIGKIPACKGPFVDIDAAALLAADPR